MVSKRIRTRIDDAVKVSQDYPEALRPAILSYLLSSPDWTKVSAPSVAEHEVLTDKEVGFEGTLTRRATSSQPSGGSDEDNDWFSKLAEDLDVPPDKLRDIYEITDDGKPRVRVILQDDSVPKRQIGYTLLHLLAYEKIGTPGATSDELRELVRGKKAYDTGNFTRNFKVTDNLKPYGNPGQGNTEWVLTTSGRQEGKQLIKRLCLGELR